MTQAELKIQFVRAYLKARKDQLELVALKAKVLPIIKDTGEIVAGHKLATALRPVYSDVTLDEARKYDAVIKAIDSAKLTAEIKAGAKVEGVKYTKYITVT